MPGPVVSDAQSTRRLSNVTSNFSGGAPAGGIGQPGTWESFIPVWGSLRSSIDYFQTGHPVLGTIQGALAVSDLFLAKAAVTALGKLAVVGFAKLTAKELVAEGVSISAKAGAQLEFEFAKEVSTRNVSYLYQKVGKLGEHLKFGITDNPATRYTAAELNGGRLRIIARGERSEMLRLERELHETLPIGPEERQLFYIEKQVENGLRPPPY